MAAVRFLITAQLYAIIASASGQSMPAPDPERRAANHPT